MTQPTLINLHLNEYTQGLRYYPFTVNLDRCVRSCNTLDDLSDRKYVPNKSEDLNLDALNIIGRINESKILTKNISCKCKPINVGASANIQKDIICVKKLIFGILLHAVVLMANV